jgi:3-deoxy-D-manno-octulosonate 8-phosphate phosphatase (KDO 8-P phosphatase)
MNTLPRVERIRAVILDIDGVLTDGRIGYSAEAHELKFFDVHDGLGVKLLQAAGLKVALLSGRSSLANRRRAQELGLDAVVEGESDKVAGLERVLHLLGVAADECCYLGDDLVDVPVMRRVGLALAVADAAEEVRGVAHRVTARAGGRGAVRELAEWLLRQTGRWQEVTRRYELG